MAIRRSTPPPLAHREFINRIAQFFLIAMALLFVSLLMGVAGYHYIAQLSWIDALLNASMILTGMGPVSELHSTGAKLFASFYALFSGVIFLSITALLMGIVFHRVLHIFHMPTPKEDDDEGE